MCTPLVLSCWLLARADTVLVCSILLWHCAECHATARFCSPRKCKREIADSRWLLDLCGACERACDWGVVVKIGGDSWGWRLRLTRGEIGKPKATGASERRRPRRKLPLSRRAPLLHLSPPASQLTSTAPPTSPRSPTSAFACSYGRTYTHKEYRAPFPPSCYDAERASASTPPSRTPLHQPHHTNSAKMRATRVLFKHTPMIKFLGRRSVPKRKRILLQASQITH